jgi:sulfoxide reductase heme-binding subunit YedZ
VALHLIFYIADSGVSAIFREINSILALIATIFMIALAMTSAKWAIRLLKKNWKRLHRLSYVIAILAVFHVVLIEE